MLLVELALQGLRGFPNLSRLALKPGLNVLQHQDRDLRQGVIDAIYHTVYPDLSRGSATAALADASATESRIALTFVGRDRVTYRLLREATTGATKLFKYSESKRKYVLFSSTAQEVAQYVRVQQRIPDEVIMERLFIFSPKSMPSMGINARSRSGMPLVSTQVAPSAPGISGSFRAPAPARVAPGRAPSIIAPPPRDNSHISGILQSPMGFGSSMNMTNALVQSEIEAAHDPIQQPVVSDPNEATEQEKRTQLIQLKDKLRSAVRHEQSQTELDQLNLRKFELAERAERANGVRRDTQRLRREVEQSSDLKDLPVGFAERIRNYEELKTRFEAENNRLIEEGMELEQQAGQYTVLPLVKDRYFQASIAVSGLFVALAVVLAKPALALFNILGAVVAVGAAFRWVADLEASAKLNWRLKSSRDRQERLVRQYDLDTGAMRRLMDKQEIDSPMELGERLEGFEKLKTQLRAAEDAERRLLADPEARAASTELQQIEQRIEDCEAEILGHDAGVSSRTLQRRINALERDLGLPLSDASAFQPMPRNSSIARAPMEVISSPDLPVVRGTGDLPPRGISIVRGTADLPPMPGSGSGSDRPVRANTTNMAPMNPLSGSGPYTPSSPSAPSAPTAPSRAAAPIARPRMPSAVPVAPSVARRAPSVAGNLGGPIAPGLPQTPAKPPGERDSLFDFGGGLIGEDDDDPGYGGGGGSGGVSASPEATPLPMLAIGGFSSGGGGTAGGYGYSDDSLPPDRSRDLMQGAIDVLHISVDQLAEKVQKRMGQFMVALTDNRFGQPTFGPRGEVTLHPIAEGQPLPYTSLEGEMLDLADAAIRLALVEYCAAKAKIFVLLDDPFEEFPERRRKLFLQMLKYMGQMTQVLVLTSKSDISGHPIVYR